MVLSKLPNKSTLTDAEFVQVQGPDGRTFGFVYDAEQCALFAKESQLVLADLHGINHISTDPIPSATCDSVGLMSANDKCKLDAMLQTRIGVAGFQGAGFPDDGGWMQGDIILAAGTEFISLERVGNVIRFTVDSPIPLNCSCEECAQIFWVQDETDTASIRPPSCGGKIPGVNSYGEMKIYLFPESTILDPADPAATLASKGEYPTLIFKRYDDGITPGEGEFEVTLARDAVNLTQTTIGWAMTPGPLGVPECVWFMSKDDDGNLIRFDLNANSEPGLLGNLLYKGHNLTKAMAAITDYTATVVSTNKYTCKWWNVDSALNPTDTEFTATNVWQYDNPDTTRELVLDSTISLLPIGTLVDIWFFKIGEVSGVPILRYYFSKRPMANAAATWGDLGGIEFGDQLTARNELEPSVGETDQSSSEVVSNHRDIEGSLWGITGFDQGLFLFSDVETDGPITTHDLNTQHRAVIDTTRPGLLVDEATATSPFSERPVCVWHRQSSDNMLINLKIGRAQGYTSSYPPYDILLGAPIDSATNKYGAAEEVGIFSGATGDTPDNWVRIRGLGYHDVPEFGALRVITDGSSNSIWNYSAKIMLPTERDAVVLASVDVFPTSTADVIVELLHQEYSCPCIRLEMAENGSEIQFEAKVGTLDMSEVYEEDVVNDVDDYVRGLTPGFAVSAGYTQDTSWDGIGTKPGTNVADFVIYDGGDVGATEIWNDVEIMLRDDQVWIWWNGLLVPPDSAASAVLPTPVAVTTAYFPVTRPRSFGKFGMRLWPGASVRSAQIRGQARNFSEFTNGQLVLS